MIKHESMRGYLAYEIYEAMKHNPDIYLITGDLGYGMWDGIRDTYPHRYFNVGAAEQTMMDVAVGMAYGGKIPIVYSITNFLIYRPFETIRTYINHERLNVKMIGSGRNQDYAHDGISHWSEDVKDILNPLTNIIQLYPETKEAMPHIVNKMLISTDPYFISLRR